MSPYTDDDARRTSKRFFWFVAVWLTHAAARDGGQHPDDHRDGHARVLARGSSDRRRRAVRRHAARDRRRPRRGAAAVLAGAHGAAAREGGHRADQPRVLRRHGRHRDRRRAAGPARDAARVGARPAVGAFKFCPRLRPPSAVRHPPARPPARPPAAWLDISPPNR